MTNVLLIGSGGREHALCWKLAQSDEVKKIYAAPGSVGIGEVEKVENLNLEVKDRNAVARWALEHSVGLVVVGPEDPLAAGLADQLAVAGVPCFGPTAAAARIEADKAWAKDFMHRHGIPTARYESFTSPDKAKNFISNCEYEALVVKASGLAAGKGVVVASNRPEACEAADTIFSKFGKAGETIVVEELLSGEEISVLCFCDGKNVRPMLPAQDHKRVWDGDLGGNTGGMGAYCPCPLITDEQLDWVTRQVLQPAADGLAADGHPFVGVLYAGLMMTKDGPRVLEFNCRFGDPETQVILPLLDEDLFKIMMACCRGTLGSLGPLKWKEGLSAVGVVMASKGYPESSSKGDVIKGVESVTSVPGMLLFNSGVGRNSSGQLVTAGGRVLINVCLARSLEAAAASATRACSLVTFPGAHFRSDIAHKGIPMFVLNRGRMSYRASGVDISAGEALVEGIKPSAASTTRPGVLDSLGGFGAMFSTKLAGYKDPVLVSGTDGVGTKLKVAFEAGRHDTVGQDLVAMCVNDILCHGAEPLFFLDYFACGKLDVGTAKQVVDGVAAACALANCALIGGETAEMPGLYQVGEYDLGGFAVGAVESGQELPAGVSEGDSVLCIPSSGAHSNGYSLLRKVLQVSRLSLKDKAPFSQLTIGEEVLRPTRLYVRDLLPHLRKGRVHALAHITGGGLTDNLPRVLPKGLQACLDASLWKIPPIFPWLAITGGISESEMLRTFNCGVGMVIITDRKYEATLISEIKDCRLIGRIEKQLAGEPQVVVKHFVDVMSSLMKPYVKSVVERATNRKRIGVLISGTGSNLQALIDSIQAGELDGDIVMVISNKPGVEGLDKAAKAGIPTKVIKHQGYKTREEFEAEVDKELRGRGVELVVLAGFMRVLTGWFVSRWRGRLVNVHPALLPLFKGVDAHKQALEAGVRVSGCSVHFVEEDIDAGAIIAQAVVPIEVGDDIKTLQERVKLVEHETLPSAVQLLCSGKVYLDLHSGRLVWN